MTLQHIAIVGATGVVGTTILSILEERAFPVGKLSLLASESSAGTKLTFAGKPISVLPLKDFDFTGVDIAFFSAGSEVSDSYAKKAAGSGAVVIDNTSRFRYDPTVPLVVPEVNAHVLTRMPSGGIIANPNCSTAGLVVVLKPLHDAFGIERRIYLRLVRRDQSCSAGYGGCFSSTDRDNMCGCWCGRI